MDSINKKLVLIFFLLRTATVVNAQFFDSLQMNVGLQALFSSKNYQPFWLVSNRYGTVADRKTDLSPFINISGKHVISEHEYMNDHGFYDYNDLTLSYGLSIYNNNQFRSIVADEGYMKLGYKNWSLRAGRFRETTGDIDPELSGGSLGISGNAVPIPKIGIAVTDYTAVPYMDGWLQFRGTLAHGWLGSNRYIKNSYYHEKTFFLRIGPGRLKLYAGIEHFVEWGGKLNGQQLDKSLKGFMDVFFAKSDGSNTGETNGTHTGDQRGVLEGGAYWENEDVAVHAYLQKPFEGRQDISPRTMNMLAGFSVSVKDRYLGLQKIVCEIISTNSINNHVAPEQRESYYNSNLYKTGWEYQNNVIGTPLFINRARASNYFPEIQPFNWNSADQFIPGNANIVDNRVLGIHTGILYSVTGVLDGKTLLTYTRNNGSIIAGEPFISHKNQIYALQQFSYDIPRHNLTVTFGMGIDAGQMSGTVLGGLFAIEWNIIGRRNTDDLY